MQRFILGIIGSIIWSLLLSALPASASSLSTTSLVTKSIDGHGAALDTFPGAANTISKDGRILVFASEAANLVPNDTNGDSDIFAYDRLTKKIELISMSDTHEQGHDDSMSPSISADGRYVAFTSKARNISPELDGAIVYDRLTKQNIIASKNTLGLPIRASVKSAQINAGGNFVVFSTLNPLHFNDTNDSLDVVVRDFKSNVTRPVSVDNTGNTGEFPAIDPTISADGRFVAFSTRSALVPEDTNDSLDVYVRDIQMGVTKRVNVASNGQQTPAFSESYSPTISVDGKWVVFLSTANNLVAGDTNDKVDVFLYDIQTRTTKRMNVNNKAQQANGDTTHAPSISGDGKFIIFTSTASNLVHDDDNKLPDVFIRYRDNGITRRINRASHDGPIAETGAQGQAISADGKAIAFSSTATNLTHFHAQASNIYLTYNPVIDIAFYDSYDIFDLMR